MDPTDTIIEPVNEAPANPVRDRARAARRLWPLPVATAVAIAAAAWYWPRPDAQQLYDQARELARDGRYAQAEAVLARLVRLGPPRPVVLLLRAQVAAARDHVDDALAELARIPNDDPLAPLAWLSRGQLEARRGRLAPAEAAFRATLELNPRAVQARRELVYIYSVQQRLGGLDEQLAALTELGALDLPNLLHWGLVRHAEWAADIDLPALSRYVAADPDDRHSRLALAEALWRAHRADEAADALAPLPEADPDARALRARMALDRGDLDAVEAELSGPPDDHPGLARLRARMALARGEPAAAVGHFRLALAADPRDHATKHGLALALEAAGAADEAAELRRALERHNELGELLVRAKSRRDLDGSGLPLEIGRACVAAGRPLEARAWLRLAIADDPLDAEAQGILHELTAARPPAE